MLISPTKSLAQTCEKLPVDNSPVSCQSQANRPRCEGMYRSRAADYAGTTPVSTAFGKVPYNTRRDQNLEIRLAAEVAAPPLIQGIGIPERLYYRLDANRGRTEPI